MDRIFSALAQELNVHLNQVQAAVVLLDEGATVPFISRYRKEVTGGLDDGQLRQLEERLRYMREMEDRRASILKSIDEQGKLTDELKAEILKADTKNRLEDLYLPYKQKRRTKGQIAIEAGLEPLADSLLQNPSLNPETEAKAFVDADKGVADEKAALDGAKFILMERFAQSADLLQQLRDFLWQEAQLSVRVMAGKEQEAAKYQDYFEHDEALKGVPSHRALAILRGRNEGFLSVSLVVGDPNDKLSASPCEAMVAGFYKIENQGRAADRWLAEVVKWTWRVKLLTHLETELVGRIRESAEEEAIKVFATNLKDLLMAAPAGYKTTLGLDPGLRTGCKVAVVDETGKVLDHGAIFPHQPQNQMREAKAILRALCLKHGVELIAIGNGTASRETDRMVGELMKEYPELKIQKIVVSEAGASVYSASELAAKEFPELDVTIRGAISIARRLQDPLAELVKIEPKAIGVGQYQHDVSQPALARSLDAVVEDCVNAVGVDLNTASAPLLTRVSGLNSTIANNIVSFRETNGAYASRADLKKVPRLGEKTFEQAAGFLRINGGSNPLDASSVHPESYGVVKSIASKAQKDVAAIIGDGSFLKAVNAADFVSDEVGLPTVKDILSELEKPGRDPRPEFVTAEFKEGVEEIKDLKDDMILEGVVSNVAAFGAFVDVGVHQDGLVHISMMSDQFIDDPRQVVKAGDVVKVKVMEVDVPRKRIALSMRMSDNAADYQAEKSTPRSERKPKNSAPRRSSSKSPEVQQGGGMAALFAQAQKKKGGRL
ncbi:RNA-binding transcriptional accessory protein [Bermanella marisrubri]|uniref:S1 RNA binding domain protein n=1 Tax=Bermanella marisrubri TaxID=207949 RepID=Q1MZ00_9GAMM|nr:Tex family protein [Bermanella marisrubri]EAT11228.1 S1 RNA binding domain protein [Oceanobacter sp. RED65] [Bermanella marisrubri]QIZ85638.1 RNA-binding transcriptional accessory protein [Bermanella marisrubri]